MFTNMKPLPKMLIIGAIVAAAAFGVSKLIEKHKASVAAQAAQVDAVPVAPTPVPAETVPATQPVPAQTTSDQTPINEPDPGAQPTVTSGDAGMKALLAKGKKQ